mmetsp:Transcript_36524/g.103937  ORF Transcript_36524/g.103937 Transcript_36524/m.103937 type:complete len:145 (+) Transcript_36524:446-880(+)
MGVAILNLCTNGTLKATAMLHNGKSMVIATHIHMSNGRDGTNGANGEGPPMINFSGSNRQGMIDDGTPYAEECEMWTRGSLKMDDMDGALTGMFNRGVSLAQRVEDIAERPEMYYFNVHTLASWKQWGRTGSARGMCRGTLHRR